MPHKLCQCLIQLNQEQNWQYLCSYTNAGKACSLYLSSQISRNWHHLSVAWGTGCGLAILWIDWVKAAPYITKERSRKYAMAPMSAQGWSSWFIQMLDHFPMPCLSRFQIFSDLKHFARQQPQQFSAFIVIISSLSFLHLALMAL